VKRITLLAVAIVAGAAPLGAAEKPRLVLDPGGHTALVTAVGFLNNRQLVSVGYDRAVRVWDLGRGRAIQTHRLPGGLVSGEGRLFALAIHRPGGLLAVAGEGYRAEGRFVSPIYLFDLVKGVFAGALPGHDGLTWSLAFSPDGKLLASGGSETTLLWDVAGRRLKTNLIGHPKPMTALAFSSDGRYLAAAGGKAVSVWSVATEKRLAAAGFDRAVHCLAWAPGGATLGVGGYDEKIHLWNWQKEKAPGRWIGPVGNAVLSLAFSPDGKTVYATRADGRGERTSPFYVKVGTNKGTALPVARPNNLPQFLALSPDGKHLVLTRGEDHRLDVRKTESPARPVLFLGAEEPPPTLVGWHEKGELLAWSGGGRGKRVFSWGEPGWAEDPRSGFQTAAEKLSNRLGSLGFERGKDAAWIRPAQGERISLTMPSYLLGGVQCGALLRGKSAGKAVVGSGNKLRLFDARTGRTLRDLEGSSAQLSDVAGSPGGTYVVAASTDGVVRIWPAEGANAEVFGGVGFMSRQEKGFPRVTFVMEDAPASGKLQKGDLIRGVAQAGQKMVVLEGLPEGEASRLIRGPVGSSVTLYVAREGEKKLRAVTLRRAAITGAVPVARPLLSIYSQEEEWIAWTEEGYYAGSASGEGLMGWQVEEGIRRPARFLPVSHFRAAFHRPDVVAKVFRLGSVSRALAEADKERGTKSRFLEVASSLPAKVTLDVGRAGKRWRARAVVTPQSKEPVTEVLLLVDGRAVKVEADKEKEGDRAAYEWRFDVTPGSHSVQALVRAGVDGYSQPPVKVVQPGKAAKPKLHIVGAGLCRYKSPTVPKLDSPARVARDFTVSLRGNSAKLYDKGEDELLTDDKATKDNLVDALARVAEKAGPDDVTVFFFVGHSMRDPKGGTFLLPYDAERKTLQTRGLSDAELLRLLNRIPGRRVVLLDSCYSAAVGDGATLLQLANRIAKPESGIVLFCSCRSKETSLDAPPPINATLFGHFLIEALKGKGGRDEDTQAVTFEKVRTYVREKVRRESRKFNTRQTPYVPFNSEQLEDLPLTRP
jgi:WD40 repeat protein